MKRAILTILALSVIANVVWLQFITHDLRVNQIKTTATVVAVGSCGGRGGNSCPVFRYYDRSGRSHDVSSTEGYNFINEPLFGVKVGDKKTVWYEKSNPDASYILYGAAMLSVWVLPIIIGLVVCGILALIYWRANINRLFERLRRNRIV